MAGKKSEAKEVVPTVTGGYVIFSRSVKPADYEGKKAEVQLTFAVPDGAELGSFLDTVGALAQSKALELVGLKVGAKVAQAAPEPAQVAPKATPDEAPAKGSKAALEAEQAEKLNGKAKVTIPNISTGEERTDPAQTAAEEWGAELVEAVEISDAAMKDACSKRNQVIKNPQAIKAVIAEFVTFPKGCADIPQAERQKFLDKLAKTK